MSRIIVKGQTVYGVKPIVTDGLTLYYDAANIKSYISPSTSWNNLINPSPIATLFNGVAFNSNNGGSLVFDGTNDYGSFSYNWGTNFSVNVWVYPISYISDYARILGTISYGFEIAIGLTGMVKYYNPWTDTGIIASINQWKNLTFVKNGSTMKVYSNGSLLYTGTISVSSGGTVYLCSNFLTTEWSNIRMSNFSIYNKSLTDSEVLQNYNALKGRFGL